MKAYDVMLEIHHQQQPAHHGGVCIAIQMLSYLQHDNV